jgi:hypothetical protein
MQYRSTNPEGGMSASILHTLLSGFVVLYCIQSEGLVDNYFLAHCFHGSAPSSGRSSDNFRSNFLFVYPQLYLVRQYCST